MSNLLTPKEVAEKTGISLRTFHRWLQAGWHPPYRRTPTGHLLFDPDDVAKWLESMRVESDRDQDGAA